MLVNPGPQRKTVKDDKRFCADPMPKSVKAGKYTTLMFHNHFGNEGF